MDYISIGEGNKSLVIVKSIAAVLIVDKTRFKIVLKGADAINMSYSTEAQRDAALETIREVIGDAK